MDQRVDVLVTKRYVLPPSKPFSGPGNRLGAPVAASSSASATSPSSSSSTSGTGAAGGTDRVGITTRFAVDTTRPTTSVQVRLADSTRIVARANLTEFINAARRENLRPYTIGTTFPQPRARRRRGDD
ncbi:hypothetical protein FB451DRAFT_394109 [Mycena latifolia]|nr:hypothetical protein FB451DRAFT_394109 [Mycena latifolia]